MGGRSTRLGCRRPSRRDAAVVAAALVAVMLPTMVALGCSKTPELEDATVTSVLVTLPASTTSIITSNTVSTTGSVSTLITTTTTESAEAAARRPAPSFNGVTLDGVPVSLETYSGRPLVLVFWESG